MEDADRRASGLNDKIQSIVRETEYARLGLEGFALDRRQAEDDYSDKIRENAEKRMQLIRDVAEAERNANEVAARIGVDLAGMSDSERATASQSSSPLFTGIVEAMKRVQEAKDKIAALDKESNTETAKYFATLQKIDAIEERQVARSESVAGSTKRTADEAGRWNGKLGVVREIMDGIREAQDRIADGMERARRDAEAMVADAAKHQSLMNALEVGPSGPAPVSDEDLRFWEAEREAADKIAQAQKQIADDAEREADARQESAAAVRSIVRPLVGKRSDITKRFDNMGGTSIFGFGAGQVGTGLGDIAYDIARSQAGATRFSSRPGTRGYNGGTHGDVLQGRGGAGLGALVPPLDAAAKAIGKMPAAVQKVANAADRLGRAAADALSKVGDAAAQAVARVGERVADLNDRVRRVEDKLANAANKVGSGV
jgi:hypothetical protein